MYWPACDFITYRYIPLHLQVLSKIICSVFKPLPYVDCKVHGQDLSRFCVECNNFVVAKETLNIIITFLLSHL